MGFNSGFKGLMPPLVFAFKQ